MGNCCSCRASSKATIKLILLDGGLKEFSSPVKIGRLLPENSGSFICNSDEMDFDEIVTSIDEDEELQPGQLYFELPLSWLTRRLEAEDMASLAVKASVALKRSTGREMKCGCFGPQRVDPGLMFDSEDCVKVKQSTRLPQVFDKTNEMISVKKKGGIRGGVGSFTPGRFTANLSAILEEDY